MKTSLLKTGTLLWMGIKGQSLSVEEKKFIQKEKISGLILFKRNIVSLQQLYDLCQEIHYLNPSPVIAIDREGGEVDRLKHLDVPSWPAPKCLAKVATIKEIKHTSFLLHQELSGLGIDVNFAPCLDVEHIQSSLFNNRLFGSAAIDVIRFGESFIEGAKKARMHTCIKHFPGHGAVKGDSHFQLPIDTRSMENIQSDINVFQSIILRCNVTLLMTAHVLYQNWDKKYPATLSKKILTEYLKKQMSFSGLVLSDDLDMQALYCFMKIVRQPKSDYQLEYLHSLEMDPLILALNAGVDVLLKCHPQVTLFEIPELLRTAVDKNQLCSQKLAHKINQVRQFRTQCIRRRQFLSFDQWLQMVTHSQSYLWCQEIQKRIKIHEALN